MLMITPQALRLLRGPLAATLVSRAAPVSLAGSASRRAPVKKQLGARRYEAMIESIVSILKTRVCSKFEFEGPSLAGIRSRLCLEGWRWPDADRTAREIVDKALSRVGAVRPSYWECQPDYTHDGLIEYYYCTHCGGLIDEERRNRGVQTTKYCGDLCRASAKIVRDRLHGERVNMAEHLARCAAKSAQTLAERSKHCEFCGEFFFTKRLDAVHCSKRCAGEALRYIGSRPCQHCGTVFMPAGSKNNQKFCRHECSAAATIKQRPDLTCKGCGDIFRPRGASDIRSYCTDACARRYRSYGKKRPAITCEAVI